MATRNHNIAELRALDVAHHLAPHQDHGMMRDIGGARIITGAEGCYIQDGEGVRLLDGMAGLWCVQVGYGREELARAAYDQMTELAYYNAFFKTAAPSTIELAAKVSSLLGEPFSHVFFNNSGSEAVDTLIRIARFYWQLKGEPQRNTIIGRVNGYHGSTLGGVSAGGMKAMHDQGGPFVPGFEHVMQPYAYNERRDDESEHDFAARAADAVEQRILQIGPQNVAAFLGEPVQGAGGVIIPPEGYWPRIEAICRKYGILLACDEVICGFGRLGSWFGFQHYGVTPDLVSMAKGLSSGYLPISAVGVSSAIVETLRGAGGDFVHGFTYSGHPTCAAVALKNIEILEREDLVNRTASVSGPHLAKAMRDLAHHPLVGETRSLGLIGAVEIVENKATRRRFGGVEGKVGAVVRDLCIANGLMVRAVRDSIVMSPPLVISRAEIDQMVGIIRRSLDEATPVLRERFAEAA